MAGKNNCISDYLLRNPVRSKTKDEGAFVTDNFGRTVSIEAHVNAAQTLDRYENKIKEDPLLEEIRDAGSMDKTYIAVIKVLRENCDPFFPYICPSFLFSCVISSNIFYPNYCFSGK